MPGSMLHSNVSCALLNVRVWLVTQAVPLLGLAVAVYALVSAFAYFAAEAIMFQPPRPSYEPGQSMLWLETSAGVRIAAAFLPDDDAEYTILYSHGNAEDLGQVLPTLRALNGLGFAVMGYDYPGYGLSEGRASTDSSIRAIEAAYRHLTRERGIAAGRIILYGRSIGSGPTMALAAGKPVGGVVLESAIISAYRVVTRYPLLPFDRFPNLRRIRTLDCPVLVIHGTADRIVPFYHGRTLFDAAPGPKQKLWVDGGGHNDLAWIAGEALGHALREFVEMLRRESPAATGPSSRTLARGRGGH